MEFCYSKYRQFFTADFETSTTAWNVDRARVWLWDICDTELRHTNGTSLDDFMYHISNFDKCLFSFHNLSYDGSYILYWLLENMFIFTPDSKPKKGFFTTVISPQGSHYAYTIHFPNGNIVTINDSFKHNSMSIGRLADIYKLPIKKGSIDYDLYRDEQHTPTEEELEYIHNDTEIIMRILLEDIADGFDMFTESGNSKKFFRSTVAPTKQEYELILPILSTEEDAFVRRSYRGGYCYLKESKFNKILGKMVSLDINSMYPAAMLHRPLPYGNGVYVSGYAPETAEYNKMLLESDTNSPPVFVQHLYCSFNIKENRVPTVARKSFGCFSTKDLYLKSSECMLCELWLTSVDLELLFENYDVWDLQFVDAFIYMTKCGHEVTPQQAEKMELDDIIMADGVGSLYYDYLYPWRLQKEHSKGGKRDKAKKQQNLAYGWQATSKNGDLAMPYINEHNILSYKRYKGEERKVGYIPIAAFITAWSRKLLIDAILANYERFVYCDTDSLYLLGQELPNLPIHNSLYGYFKIEHYIDKAKFLGCKRYMYHTEDYSTDPNETIVKCCGAPISVTSQMTFENFVPYNSTTGEGLFEGKLANRLVVGGKHLETTTYKLIC